MRGRLGQSLRTGRPVTTELSEKLGATVLLAVTAMIVALVVAVPLGIIAAVRANTWVDNVAMALALVGVSMPNFWLGPLLALLFGVYLGWLPISGRGPSAEFLIGSVPRVPPAYLVLPALTLGLALAAILARMTRASLVEELKELYVRAARSRGLSTRRTVLRHALRNGLIPIITIVGLQFGAVLTGTIITETIFAWPGLGRLLIQSIQFRDYPMVQGCILLIAVTYVAVNLLTDLAYGLADRGSATNEPADRDHAGGARPGGRGARPLARARRSAVAGSGPASRRPDAGASVRARRTRARHPRPARRRRSHLAHRRRVGGVGVRARGASWSAGSPGYAGGWADTLIGRVIDVLMAFPGILLAIALVAALGPSLRNVVIALATIGWVGYARLVRGQVLKAREFEYVQAARSLGASPPASWSGTCCRLPIPPCSCRPRSGWPGRSSPKRP